MESLFNGNHNYLLSRVGILFLFLTLIILLKILQTKSVINFFSDKNRKESYSLNDNKKDKKEIDTTTIAIISAAVKHYRKVRERV